MSEVSRAQALADEQAKDEGLWRAATSSTLVSVVFMQAALRRLHQAIEEDTYDREHERERRERTRKSTKRANR
jgi:hypothetical protein